MSKVEQYITSIPDFPKEGIIFRDITTVLGICGGCHSKMLVTCSVTRTASIWRWTR